MDVQAGTATGVAIRRAGLHLAAPSVQSAERMDPAEIKEAEMALLLSGLAWFRDHWTTIQALADAGSSVGAYYLRAAERVRRIARLAGVDPARLRWGPLRPR